MNEGRMLRKRISRSQKFASLSKDAKILFCMLIPHYDPHGKMNGSAHFIKGEVVPYLDEFTVPIITKCLQEISTKTSVKYFEHEGLAWLHSTNDHEHQNFNKCRVRKDLLPSYEQLQSNSGVESDSIQSNSGVTHSQIGIGIGIGNRKETLTTQKALVRELFDEFWEAYPRKTGKGKAQESWKRLKPTSETLGTMLSTLRWQTASAEWQRESGRFIPLPATWLNQKRWLDEPSGLKHSVTVKGSDGEDYELPEVSL